MNIFSTELADELNESKYLEAGIHENVKFEGVERFVSPNGNKSIQFHFSKNGKEFTHTEWEPRKFSSSEDDKNLQERTSKLVRRVGKRGIMAAFYSTDELNFVGTSFDEFINWVIEKLSVVNKDELLRIKIVYNKNGFSTFPNFVTPPFIQKMSDATVTVIPSDKDVFIRPIKPDAEEAVDTSDEALPF